MLACKQYNKDMDIHEFARLGGHARARSLSDKERSIIARKAANVRWGKSMNTVNNEGVDKLDELFAKRKKR